MQLEEISAYTEAEENCDTKIIAEMALDGSIFNEADFLTEDIVDELICILHFATCNLELANIFVTLLEAHYSQFYDPVRYQFTS